MSASCIAYNKYNTNWIVFFSKSTPPIHENKMCHNKQETNTVRLCQNICSATQLFPGFSMPLLTYHNTYIQISASGIKSMHHSTSFPVIPISISGMNISRQKSGNTA